MTDKETGTKPATDQIDDELAAMGALASALKDLDSAARGRVIGWAAQKFGATGTSPAGSSSEGNARPGRKSAARGNRRRAASSSTDKEAPARRSRATAPTQDKTLNLRPSGAQSFEDFVKEKQPKTNNDRHVLSVFWLKNFGGVEKVGANQVFTCFKDRNWRLPANPRNALQVTASTKGWLDTEDMDDIKLTPSGDNWVNHDLPAKKAE